jgi:hypothetical protein
MRILKTLVIAIRGMRRRPGLAMLAAASLALGIGANTAVFSAAHALLFQPLAVERPERLAAVFTYDCVKWKVGGVVILLGF